MSRRKSRSATAVISVEPNDDEYQDIVEKLRAVGYVEIRATIHAANNIELTQTLIDLHTELASVGAKETLISVEGAN